MKLDEDKHRHSKRGVTQKINFLKALHKKKQPILVNLSAVLNCNFCAYFLFDKLIKIFLKNIFKKVEDL